MTDLQEAILDRLMAETISVQWVGGPLHIAALVVDPKISFKYGGQRRRQTAVARVLGLPHLYCEAFHGASAGLPDENDRRKLAISVFSVISPDGQPKSTPYTLAREIACWMATQAHRLVCKKACSLNRAMRTFIANYEKGKALSDPFRAKMHCPQFTGSARLKVSLNTTAAHSSVVAYRNVVRALQISTPTIACVDAARESARCTAKAAGVDGAAGLLLELAQRMKL